MEQGEERGGEKRRANRVEGRRGLGKSRCPRELEGLTELSVARSGASREEEIPEPVWPCFTTSKYKGAISGNVLLELEVHLLLRLYPV